jgi:F-type H+-transporting ATPase subunit b
MPETLEFLSLNIWSVLVAIGNLLILFLIMKKFLFKPVNQILEQRAEEVDKIYSEAEDIRTKVKLDKELYEEKLKNAKAESDQLIKSATARARLRRDEILQAASLEAEQKKQKAERDILLEKKKAINEIKDNLSEIVIELAEQVIEKEIDPLAHKSLIDEAIEELGEQV